MGGTGPEVETYTLEPAPGHRIVVDHLPGSGPCTVFLHGLASTRVGAKSEALLAWSRTQGRAFARFDFRGHGDSTGVLGRVTLTEKIEDARTVLENLGPSLLVGSSMGGMIAAWLAARRPDLVRGLALLAPAFGFVDRLRHLAEGDVFVVRGQSHEIPVEQSVLEDAATYDELTLAGLLSMPVFIVHGALDDTVPVAVSRSLYDALAHDRKELWVVPRGDHRLNDSIDAILARIDSFFARYDCL